MGVFFREIVRVASAQRDGARHCVNVGGFGVRELFQEMNYQLNQNLASKRHSPGSSTCHFEAGILINMVMKVIKYTLLWV